MRPSRTPWLRRLPAAPVPRSRGRISAFALVLALGCSGATWLRESTADSLGTAPADTASASALDRLAARGLENLALSPEVLAYENRRYRHSATALGEAMRAFGATPGMVVERRLGLPAAAFQIPSPGGFPERILYPSDRGFPALPAGPGANSTRRKLDLVLGPLLTYELGQILTPARARLDLQAEVRHNPWSGGRLRAAIVIPVQNDLPPTEDDPDSDRIRPGPVLLEQFGWSPGAALFSATAGLLGNNRYGFSLGVARPLRRGEWLLDAQTDVTGFIAFPDSGGQYSTPDRWTGFMGVTYRPPGLDLGIRLRAARFLHGDEGLDVEVRRAMGDFDVAFFAQKIKGFRVIEDDGTEKAPWLGGVRLVIPIPPMTRSVRGPVRVLPIDRFAINYHEEGTPIGRFLGNVASREDYLRQLDPGSIGANRYRFVAARDGEVRPAQSAAPQWVSLHGMTGFVNTPWAGVIGDREVEFGYNHVPKEGAWEFTNQYPYETYYAALGFLPRMEVGARWNVIPGYHTFRELVPESPYVDADRMFSARVEVLQARPGRPGVALGVEDVRGTKRAHASYGVVGLPFNFYHLQNRVTLGYAPRAFEASRRTLDGLFGAFETTVGRTVAVAFEHDSEKFNTMLGINLGFGLRARIALLDLEHLSVGAGWFKALEHR